VSFTPSGAARPERRLRISDPRALRALAHPLRLALLDRLMTFGEQTAAQCAEAVGSTASNCSYHMRILARAGLVSPGESADGRERPWRAAATGLEFTPADADREPGSAAAARTIDELSLARDEALTRRALAQHDDLPSDWQAAGARHTYGLNISAAELAALTAEIDRLVRPYIALTRADAPADAQVALLRLLAFRHPEAQ
jgi:DNA-binding transcriptional ArsR family regulator